MLGYLILLITKDMKFRIFIICILGLAIIILLLLMSSCSTTKYQPSCTPSKYQDSGYEYAKKHGYSKKVYNTHLKQFK